MQNSPYCCCVYQISHPADVHRQAAHGMWMAADTLWQRVRSSWLQIELYSRGVSASKFHLRRLKICVTKYDIWGGDLCWQLYCCIPHIGNTHVLRTWGSKTTCWFSQKQLILQKVAPHIKRTACYGLHVLCETHFSMVTDTWEIKQNTV
jgi:hypothetical protein